MGRIRAVLVAAAVVAALLPACGGSTVEPAARAAAGGTEDRVVAGLTPTTTATTTSGAAVMSVPATAAPVVTGPTSTLPPLPQPQPVPDDPYFPEPEVILGTIEIPKLGLNVPLRQGVTLTTLDRGPGHWPGTALPGELGNVVVAGHRVTRTRPFRHIDKLVPGDQVIFTLTDGRRYVYEMVGTEVVDETGMHIVNQGYAYTATLFACHPPGSARYRYVVHLQLLDAPALPA